MLTSYSGPLQQETQLAFLGKFNSKDLQCDVKVNGSAFHSVNIRKSIIPDYTLIHTSQLTNWTTRMKKNLYRTHQVLKALNNS